MPAIQQDGPDQFSLSIRGVCMKLEKTAKGWRMKTRSAATRTWSLGGESWKDFTSLREVEAHYKSWRGVSSVLCREVMPDQVRLLH